MDPWTKTAYARLAEAHDTMSSVITKARAEKQPLQLDEGVVELLQASRETLRQAMRRMEDK